MRSSGALKLAVYIQERYRDDDRTAVGTEIRVLGFGELSKESGHLLNRQWVTRLNRHLACVRNGHVLTLDDQPPRNGLMSQFIHHVLQECLDIFAAAK